MPDLPPWEQGVRQGGEMDVVAMRRNLLAFKKIMDSRGLKFILFFGTLLGLKRQKTFIGYDTDVDVICLWQEHLKWHNVKYDLEHKGFNVVGEKPLHDEHIIRDGEKIEIWWMGDIKGDLCYDNNIRFRKELILPTIQEEFLGTSFEVPQHSEEILKMLYGNWRTPCRVTKGCTYKAR